MHRKEPPCDFFHASTQRAAASSNGISIAMYAYVLPLLTWLTFQPSNRSHLRLVYEGNPMGWVVEQAGGKASTGAGAMLDQQVRTFCGVFDCARYNKNTRIYYNAEKLQRRHTAVAGYHY